MRGRENKSSECELPVVVLGGSTTQRAQGSETPVTYGIVKVRLTPQFAGVPTTMALLSMPRSLADIIKVLL